MPISVTLGSQPKSVIVADAACGQSSWGLLFCFSTPVHDRSRQRVLSWCGGFQSRYWGPLHTATTSPCLPWGNSRHRMDCRGGSPNLEFGVNLEFPHSSLVFHARIPRTKQRSSQQTVIFIVFTAELLQYSTESHEIKLLLKTRPKKIKHRKQTKKTCCMAATANLFPWAVHTEILSQLFIHLLIFGCFL